MQFAQHVKVRNEKFGAVVFDTLREKVFVTNESGKKILSLMDEGLSAVEITERISQECDGDPTEIQADVNEFIDGLGSATLLATPVEETA